MNVTRVTSVIFAALLIPVALLVLLFCRPVHTITPELSDDEMGT